MSFHYHNGTAVDEAGLGLSCVTANMLHHITRSARLGSLPKITAGAAGVGVRRRGGRTIQKRANAMTGAPPSTRNSAAIALSRPRIRVVAVGSCHVRIA